MSVYLHAASHPERNNDVIVTETRAALVPINVSTGVRLIYCSSCAQNKRSVPGLGDLRGVPWTLASDSPDARCVLLTYGRATDSKEESSHLQL